MDSSLLYMQTENVICTKKLEREFIICNPKEKKNQ